MARGRKSSGPHGDRRYQTSEPLAPDEIDLYDIPEPKRRRKAPKPVAGTYFGLDVIDDESKPIDQPGTKDKYSLARARNKLAYAVPGGLIKPTRLPKNRKDQKAPPNPLKKIGVGLAGGLRQQPAREQKRKNNKLEAVASTVRTVKNLPCKKRPNRKARGKGGGRKFIPWC